jgi:integrase
VVGHRGAALGRQHAPRLPLYVDIIEAAISPRTPLDRLAPERLQALLLEHQATPRTAQLLFHVLHTACRLGVRWGWLSANPTDRLVRPAARKKARDWWTAEQCDAFIRGTETSRWWPLWAAGMAMGCRLGELLALQWADVDWSRSVVCVERTGQHVANVWQVKAPKTASGRRSIPLHPLATGALRRQRAQQAEWRLRAGTAWQDSDLVFTSQEGRPLRRFDVARAMRNAVRRLDLPAATMHSLRHMTASLALQGGAPLPLVSRFLGHSDTSITARVYSHAVGDGRAVVEALQAALGPPDRDVTATAD